ncbi:squalene/phytoene synthase family protein [Maricaulis sp. CAU 1757]
MTDHTINAQLAQSDPDRRLAALFATPDVRDGLLALYAFNQEVARIAEATSESLIGEMKLVWWRDAVSDLYAAPRVVRRHDVTEALAGLTGKIAEADLHGLVEARFDDVAAQPFASLDSVLDYVDATAVRLMRLGVQVCEAEVDAQHVQAAGRAWGLTGLLRAFPVRARIGRAPVGTDALAEHEATPAMLAQGLGPERVAAARTAVIDAAREACRELKAAGPIPAPAVPAMGYAALAPGYLDRLPDNPYHLAPERPLLARQWRLTWLSLTGR